MAQNSQTRQLQALLDIYTYSRSVSVPTKTPKVRKIHSYTDLRKLAKPHFCSSSSSSIELAYRKSGTSNRDGFCTKRLLSVLCVILDQENLRNFTRTVQSKNFLICWKPFCICARDSRFIEGGAQARRVEGVGLVRAGLQNL